MRKGSNKPEPGTPGSGVASEATLRDIEALIDAGSVVVAEWTEHAPVEDAPVEPPTPPVDIVCDCGEVLAHADGADLVLHVYERSILRPHVLRPLDLPLTWNCPRCGVQSIIPAR